MAKHNRAIASWYWLPTPPWQLQAIPEEAEHLRQRLRRSLNPHHLLKPFKSFEEALKSRDVTDYINALHSDAIRRSQVANLVEKSTVRTKASPEAAASEAAVSSACAAAAKPVTTRACRRRPSTSR